MALEIDGVNGILKNTTSDGDVTIKGNDGGSEISALVFDISAAGAATFNDKITAVGTSVFTNLDISGDIDVDGTTNLDIVDIDGAVDMASTLTMGNNIDLNGNDLVIDTDGDSYIHEESDDVIAIYAGSKKTAEIDIFGQYHHYRDGGTTFGGAVNFIHQRGTLASPTVVNSGDTIGLIKGTVYDGTAYLDGPRILFQVDGTPGDDDMPTRIVFQTTADGTAGTLGEVMRLKNDSDVIACTITSSATTDTTSALHLSKPDESASTSSRMIGFEVGGQGRGNILNGTSDSNSPSFGTGSDRRLKKNITAYTGGYDKIKSIPVQTWDEQFTDATGVKGWIADELDAVFPDAVTGTKDATKTVTNAVISEHGNCLRDGIPEEEFNELKADGQYANCTWSASKVVPAFQMSAPLKFFPDVVQALQAAITKIETLETKVAALEG